MPEVTVRTTGPGLLVVVEAEGPIRVGTIGIECPADLDRFAAWLAGVPSADRVILSAIADLDQRGGLERSMAWNECLNGEGPPPDDPSTNS